jgi:AAA domain
VNYESPEAYLARVGAVRLTGEPAGHDEAFDERTGPPRGTAVEAAAPQGPRTDENVLLLSAWLKRDLPLRRFLLGNVLCTTSRWIVYGETGVGKTLLGVDIAAAVAAGAEFLNWKGSGAPARVMYLDGEMPAETFKERMEVIAKRYGGDIAFYGYNRDVLADGEMPPLNTPEGEKWLWREIEAVEPDLIVFDSIMCLLAGSMSEEES